MFGPRLVWALLFVLAGCGGSGSSGPGYQRGDLVSVSSSNTVDTATLNLYIAGLAAAGVDTSVLNGTRYGVSLNRIVYKTVTPDGRLIDASGIVAYPLKLGSAASPLLGFQHGTIFQDDEAPSSPANYQNYNRVMIVLAGTGFIVAMPDYVGYVASTAEIHPYVHAAGLAAATVDMLRATRRLLAVNNVATNNQLFLTGYSEGGYATLATQMEMEQNLPAEFSITASMPAAGPYHMSASAQYLVGMASNPNPEYLGFVFKAYDHWYGWNRLNDIFQSPYNTVVATYYDGSQSGGAIHAALPLDATALFNVTFRGDFLGSGEIAIKADIARNDIHSWRSSVPTRLFHGDQDDVVPYFNAIDARDAMTIAGSPDVQVVNCSTIGSIPRDHAECVVDYFTQVFGWFTSLATNL